MEDTPAGVLRSGVPRSFDHMWILANTRRGRYSRLERVRLSREIAFTLVFDLCKISDMINPDIWSTHLGEPASRTLDLARLGELDIGRAVPQPIDAETRKGDQVLFNLTSRKLYSQYGVTNLLDNNTATCITVSI